VSFVMVKRCDAARGRSISGASTYRASQRKRK
jgi:hypothetical protein